MEYLTGLFKKESNIKYLLLIPLIFLLLLLLGFPGIYDLVLSLFKVELGNLDEVSFIGLENFRSVLSDGGFWHSVGFSLKFTVIVVICEVTLGVAIALFFYSQLKEHKWLISFMLLPMMTAPALMGIMFRLLLNDFVGVIPQYLSMLGIPGISFLTREYVFQTLVVIDIIQWTPFVFILAYAGLQTIPGEIIESSMIDGANAFQRFTKIILPTIAPILMTAGFFRFIDTFRIFDKIYVLTGGGPGNFTTSITIYIYKLAFSHGNVGESIAASLFLLLFSLIPLLISLKFIVREEVA
ncbi:MAG: carbohydrate ABC transporter permease [Bacillota bacterium]